MGNRRKERGRNGRKTREGKVRKVKGRPGIGRDKGGSD